MPTLSEDEVDDLLHGSERWADTGRWKVSDEILLQKVDALIPTLPSVFRQMRESGVAASNYRMRVAYAQVLASRLAALASKRLRRRARG